MPKVSMTELKQVRAKGRRLTLMFLDDPLFEQLKGTEQNDANETRFQNWACDNADSVLPQSLRNKLDRSHEDGTYDDFFELYDDYRWTVRKLAEQEVYPLLGWKPHALPPFVRRILADAA